MLDYHRAQSLSFFLLFLLELFLSLTLHFRWTLHGDVESSALITTERITLPTRRTAARTTRRTAKRELGEERRNHTLKHKPLDHHALERDLRTIVNPPGLVIGLVLSLERVSRLRRDPAVRNLLRIRHTEDVRGHSIRPPTDIPAPGEWTPVDLDRATLAKEIIRDGELEGSCRARKGGFRHEVFFIVYLLYEEKREQSRDFNHKRLV